MTIRDEWGNTDGKIDQPEFFQYEQTNLGWGVESLPSATLDMEPILEELHVFESLRIAKKHTEQEIEFNVPVIEDSLYSMKRFIDNTISGCQKMTSYLKENSPRRGFFDRKCLEYDTSKIVSKEEFDCLNFYASHNYRIRRGNSSHCIGASPQLTSGFAFFGKSVDYPYSETLICTLHKHQGKNRASENIFQWVSKINQDPLSKLERLFDEYDNT